MLFLLKIKLCFGILNLSKAQAFDKKLNVVLYIVNVAGIGFICLNYYEVEIHFQYLYSYLFTTVAFCSWTF